MARFLVRRIALGLFTLWLVTVAVFLIFFVGPGPGFVAHTLAGRQATPAQVAAVSHRLALDRPIFTQYWYFLVGNPSVPGSGLLHGNLGYDFYHDQPVNSILKAAFPISLSLVVGAAVLWLVMGVLSGIVSAVRSRSVYDRTFTVLALVFYSMPTFVLGFLFLLLLYYELTIHGVSLFPGSGYTSFTTNPFQWFRGLILPWFTLALVSAAVYTRLTRGSMLDVLGEDYIRTARSKGLSERRVIFRHALRSALTPVVTQFGIDVGVLFGGAIITEVVFGMPGLGYTAFQAIQQQDLPVIIGVVIITATAVVVANIIVDAVYAILDPRVRLH
ncbi:MAG TPA: ABC transporter permease [Streptosporangiaceae bacterium]|nr:ABC transporter permease [Streptosporangiaceae bacterium]